MNKELDAKLVAEFPNLYKDRHGDMKKTCMCWGIECGDGWYNLIRDLSAFLEDEITKTFPEDIREHCKASQVKSKFGQLRFDMAMSTHEMNEAIEKACDLSAKTCETCGKPGSARSNYGWISTSCDECNTLRKNNG